MQLSSLRYGLDTITDKMFSDFLSFCSMNRFDSSKSVQSSCERTFGNVPENVESDCLLRLADAT